jgi:purine-binding chemotaxis protein CheW
MIAMQFLIFHADTRTFALELSFIERVVWSAAMIPIPKEDAKKRCGMINIYGEIMPVVSMRDLLQLPEREMELTDQFIVCHHQEERLAVWVDRVLEVREYAPADLMPAENMFPSSLCVHKVIKEKEDIVFVWDVQELFESSHSMGVNGKAEV